MPNTILKKFSSVGILYLCMGILPVWATNNDPIQLLQSVTGRVVTALDKNKQEIQNNPGKVYEVVDHLVIPHIDFVEMARWVAGRTAWGKATPEMQAAFVKEFKVLVVRTYAVALNNYTNETIEFIPQEVNRKKSRVQISSWVMRPHKDNIRVDYRLIKQEDGWMVYDVIIEGVSILQGFQAQFSSDIRQQGLSPVTERIRRHNSENIG